MKERLTLINWMTVGDSFLCIVLHRILLALSKEGRPLTLLTTAFSIFMIAFFLLFMLTCAGFASYSWRKVNTDPSQLKKLPEFPMVSFVAAVIAIAVFAAYWMLI